MPPGIVCDGFDMLPVLQGKQRSPRPRCFRNGGLIAPPEWAAGNGSKATEGEGCSIWPQTSPNSKTSRQNKLISWRWSRLGSPPGRKLCGKPNHAGRFASIYYGNFGSWVGKHAGGPPLAPPGFVASGPTSRSDLLDFPLNLDFCMH